jgi:hypothetical protein
MTNPDEPQFPTPEQAPAAVAIAAEEAEAAVPASPAIPPAEPAPVEAPATPEPPAAAEPASPVKVVRRTRPAISEETLAAWQAKLAVEQAAKQRADNDARAARERKQAFRELRAALRRLDAQSEEPADDLAELRADRLALDVHQAPERVRTVIAATLRLLTAKRRR